MFYRISHQCAVALGGGRLNCRTSFALTSPDALNDTREQAVEDFVKIWSHDGSQYLTVAESHVSYPSGMTSAASFYRAGGLAYAGPLLLFRLSLLKAGYRLPHLLGDAFLSCIICNSQSETT
jgi:hypothetical protein